VQLPEQPKDQPNDQPKDKLKGQEAFGTSTDTTGFFAVTGAPWRRFDKVEKLASTPSWKIRKFAETLVELGKLEIIPGADGALVYRTPKTDRLEQAGAVVRRT
jgi:hypothetical protein